MEAPLSGYWVRFFKNAGFPSDVATRHAVIFSNNRIKPDMLPDLDKPSLKEMGISLMGDMIAILRYAKKVVEENTCKKFLVNSEELPTKTLVNTKVVKPIIKKVINKPAMKTVTKVKLEPSSKLTKTVSSSVVKQATNTKKKVSAIPETSRLYSDYINPNQWRPSSILKRRSIDDEDDDKWIRRESNKRIKSNEDDVEYKVIMPKGTTPKSQQILKKALEQKQTVFHRLGDSMVSSTTSINESSNNNYSPMFNVTGLGSDHYKKNSSVFNRLGNKDVERNQYNRNGNGSIGIQGILKTRSPVNGTKIVTSSAIKKPIGTMRADEEASKQSVSQSIKSFIKTKSLRFNESSIRNNNFRKKVPFYGKLASERVAVPAKSRLGASKQVTFKNTATMNYLKKPGVFSRLGV